jgi:hypothetical protein
MAGAGTCRMCFGSIEPGQEVVKDPMGDYHVEHVSIRLQAVKREEGLIYIAGDPGNHVEVSDGRRLIGHDHFDQGPA